MNSSLDPTVDCKSRVLILGDVPGKLSLARRQYYANPSNQFWKIIFGIWGSRPAEPYEHRIAFLLEKRIALWDVLKVGGEGCGPSPNNLYGFLRAHPHIIHIFFNGKEAKILFENSAAPGLDPSIGLGLLPSSSGMNTHLTLDQKIDAWMAIRKLLDTSDVRRFD